MINKLELLKKQAIPIFQSNKWRNRVVTDPDVIFLDENNNIKYFLVSEWFKDQFWLWIYNSTGLLIHCSTNEHKKFKDSIEFHIGLDKEYNSFMFENTRKTICHVSHNYGKKSDIQINFGVERLMKILRYILKRWKNDRQKKFDYIVSHRETGSLYNNKRVSRKSDKTNYVNALKKIPIGRLYA